MKIECPACGSLNVRPSRLKGSLDQVLRFLGLVPARCRECSTRFRHSLWQFATMFAALLLISLSGIAIFLITSWISHALLRRWHESAIRREA